VVERVLADAEVPGEVMHPRNQRNTHHRVHATGAPCGVVDVA
jgi:hypothetical protein